MSNGFVNLIRKIKSMKYSVGIVIGIIIGVIGIIFNKIWPERQLLSYLLQFVCIILINLVIERTQRGVIESATEVALGKIEGKYREISDNSVQLLRIFQLNDDGNYVNNARKFFFNKLIESYRSKAEEHKFYIPTDSYYKVIQDFLQVGKYKKKAINGLLLPFWYAPIEQDKALKEYTKFCKENAERYDRVTYYQDYIDGSWMDDTVNMIYNDLLSSDKSDDIAVRWLITLINSIPDLRREFFGKLENIFNMQLERNIINYINYNSNDEINEVIKVNIEKVTNFLKDNYDGTTNSKKMTKIINELFYIEMDKKNIFIKKSVIDNLLDENDFDSKEITEVGYYYKDDNQEDQFVILLNGSSTGLSVEIELITDINKVGQIKQIMSNLLEIGR